MSIPMGSKPVPRSAPHGHFHYEGGQVAEVRIEEQYGLAGCLEILDRDCRLLEELAREAGLPESCFLQAAEPQPGPAVRPTGEPIPASGMVNWSRRYPERGLPEHWRSRIARLLARFLGAPLGRVGEYIEGRLRFFLGRHYPERRPRASAVRALQAHARVFVLDGAPTSALLDASQPVAPVVQRLDTGVPPPGLRVPMLPSYLGASGSRPTAAVVASRPGAPPSLEVRDALFKLPADDVALVDDAGKLLAVGANDEKTAPEQSPAGIGVSEWPRISVVTVSYNQAKFLGECLDSVFSQDYPHLEFIVIDGGSTDGSREILEQHRGRLSSLVIERDRGQSHALNKGFALATGEVLTWLCSDDRLEPGALAAVARARAGTACDLIAGGCRIIDEDGRTKLVHHSGFITGKVSPFSFGDLASFTVTWQGAYYFFQPEVFFSRDLWHRAGAHVKEHLHYAMDYDLFLRFALAGADVFATRRILGCSRQHEAQKTRHEQPLYLPTVARILRDLRRDLASLRPDTPPSSAP